MIVSVFRSQRCLLLLQYHIRPTGSYTFSPPLRRYHAFRALFDRLVALSGAVGVGDCVQGANQIFLSILLLYHFYTYCAILPIPSNSYRRLVIFSSEGLVILVPWSPSRRVHDHVLLVRPAFMVFFAFNPSWVLHFNTLLMGFTTHAF